MSTQDADRSAVNVGDNTIANQLLVKTMRFAEADQGDAGSYAASVTLPAGAFIDDIRIESTALWDDSTSASLEVGDVADPNGFFTAVNLKATDLLVDEVIRFDSQGGQHGAYLVTATGELNSYSATERVITGTVAVGAGGGSAGETFVRIFYHVAKPTGIVQGLFTATE